MAVGLANIQMDPTTISERWPMFAASAPQGPNDRFIVVKRVIQVAGQLAQIEPPEVRHISPEVWGSGAGQHCEDSHSGLELGGEQLLRIAILKPPGSFLVNVLARSLGEADAAYVQRGRSALRTSVASTSRPAATSAFD
jgi:hypothetical protein